MSPKQKAKLTPKRDHSRADRLHGWSTTSSKLVATMKTSWPSELYQKVHLKNDHVLAFYTKWDEVLSAVTDRPTDNMLESLYKMQVEKSEELKYLVQVYVQETTIGDKKYDSCRLQLMAKKRYLVHKNQGFSFQSEKSRRGQTCNRSSEQRYSERNRQIQYAKKQLREKRLHPLDHKRPMFVWWSMRIQARPEHERQRDGTTSFTFAGRFTEPKLERRRKG